MTLEQVVAAGTDHVVWRATGRDGRLRAVKDVRRAWSLRGRAALAREAWIGRTCRHEGLARPLRLGLRAGRLVGPWLPGGSLADLLASVGPVGPRSACVVGARIGSGLAALHARGWAHGDLHLANVVLDERGWPVLVDLGRAVRLRRRPGAADADLSALAGIVRALAVGTQEAEVPEALDAALRRPTSADALARGLLAARGTVEAATPVREPIPVDPEAATTPGRSTSTAGSNRSPRRRRTTLGIGVATLVLVGVAAFRLGPGHVADPCPPSSGPAVDIDGDGCDERVRWAPSRARLMIESDPPITLSLGRPGDRLVLGDWDCDGRVTPGLRRPSTGESFRFDQWPVDHPVTAVADPLDEPSCP